jgi:pyruvate/2-oxoglutarate dehydrogenase complex dihydrolipoamide dehydrogenase (E3) component
VRGTELLEQFDPDCVAIARKALEDIGVRFVTGANVSAIKGRDGDLKVEYTEGATEAVVAAERVLAAIGRRPAYGGIDLEKAGLRPGHNGRFAIDESLRSENPRIFFAGDAAAHDQHTPVANIHGRAVAQSILEGRVVQPDTRGVPFACFTAPELAQTGLTEAKARASGIEYDVHSSTFEYLGAAIISDVRQGLVKIIAEKGTGVVIGGHIAGERAADLIYPLSMAVRGRLTIQELQSSAAVHPAFSEIVNWAAY